MSKKESTISKASVASAVPKPSAPAATSSTSSSTSKAIIPFAELKFGKLISQGKFGAVSEGTLRGTKVAIKELFDNGDTNIEKYYQREIETLTASHHPNIVQVLNLFEIFFWMIL